MSATVCRLRITLLALALLLPASFAGAASHSESQAPPPQPVMTFDKETIAIAPVEKKASVYCFGISREPKGYYTHVMTHETLLQDDGGGSVLWNVGAYSVRSIWFAVDLSTGAWVASHPVNYPASAIDFEGKNLKKDVAGDVTQLAFDGWAVDLVVVRPGTGVWGSSINSGGSKDEGKETGRVTISTLQLEPRAGTTAEAPKKLRKGDVVFALDSFRATYAVAVIGD